MHICFFFVVVVVVVVFVFFFFQVPQNMLLDRSSPDKEPFNYILRSIKNKEERIWNSSELH